MENNVTTKITTPASGSSFEGRAVKTVLPPRGHLVRTGVLGFESPKEWAKDLKEDVVNLKAGLTGKANDYQLGKNNDTAMKAGSLGLGLLLMLKNPMKIKKSMELIGAGSFFASMALWPKLFIQQPLKWQTGVDIHQKYVDSYGRKKMMYQDPQYIPFDLMSKEELNAIGDKAGIPKDIPNREELIKVHAQKVATQGNTLWMLTAGFATPIMSALMCNQAEKYLGKYFEQSDLKKTEAALNAMKNATEVSSPEMTENLAKFFGEHGKELLESTQRDELATILGAGETPLRTEIAEFLGETAGKNNVLSENQIRRLFEKIESQLGDKFDEEAFKKVVGGKNLNSDEVLEKILADIKTISEKNAQPLDESVLNSIKAKFSDFRKDGFGGTAGMKVSEVKADAEKLSEVTGKLTAKLKAVNDFIGQRVGDFGESSIARDYSEFAEAYVYDGLGMRVPEPSSPDFQKYLTEQIEKFVTEDSRYDKTLKRMGEITERFEKKISDEAMIKPAREFAQAACEEAIKELQGTKFENVARALVGYDVEAGLKEPAQGSLLHNLVENAKMRILGATSSMNRQIQMLDLMRRISKDGLETQLNFLLGGTKDLDKGLSDKLNDLMYGAAELTEDEAKKAKNVLSEFAGKEVKFAKNSEGKFVIETADELARNAWKMFAETRWEVGTLNDVSRKGVRSEILTKLKDVLVNHNANDFLAKNGLSRAEYKVLFSLAYGLDISEDTAKNLSEPVKKSIRNYKNTVIEKVIRWCNWQKPEHRLTGWSGDINNLLRHLCTGDAPKDMISEATSRMSNSSKWMKVFGGGFLGLVGATLLAERFFGRYHGGENK